MQARIWNSFWVDNSRSYFIYPLPHRLKLSLKLTFQERKIHILESTFFAKQELITHARLCVQTSWLVRISFLISAITKSFAFFLREVNLSKQKKTISCVCIAWYKHSRGWVNWVNSQQLYKPSTSSRVCITVSDSPNPLMFISGYAKTEDDSILLLQESELRRLIVLSAL